MALTETLFSRKQLGELAGLDASTLIYWTREGILRPAEGGGGKGQHRRFTYSEVNLAAVLMDVMRAGVSSAALRGLADKFHEAMDWMAEWDVTRSNEELFGHLVACREEYALQGQIELPAIPDADGISPGERSEAGRLKAVRLLSWTQLIALERTQREDDALVDRAVCLAEAISEDEWRFKHTYFYLLTTPPPRRAVPRDPARRFSYFLRHDDGSWTLAKDIHDAEQHRRYVAIDTNYLFWTMWSAM